MLGERGQRDKNSALHWKETCWLSSCRFDMRTVADVMENMEDGLQFAIQAGVDRANQGAARTSHIISAWKVLAAQFSYQVMMTNFTNCPIAIGKCV